MKHIKLFENFYGKIDKRKFRMMEGTIKSVVADGRKSDSYVHITYVYNNSSKKSKESNVNLGVSIPLSYFNDTKNPLPKVGDKCSGRFYGGDRIFGGGEIINFCWLDKYCWSPKMNTSIREEVLTENLITDLNKLKGKTIKNVDYDPYIGTFTLFFTDKTSVELGTSGFSDSDGDELYVNFNK